MEDENSLFKKTLCCVVVFFMKVHKVLMNIVDKTNVKPLSKYIGFNYKEFFVPNFLSPNSNT